MASLASLLPPLPPLPLRVDLPKLEGLIRAGLARAQSASVAGSNAVAVADPELSRAIAQVLELAPHADPEYLKGFTASELARYRDHLNAASTRGSSARWIRQDGPGVVVRTRRY